MASIEFLAFLEELLTPKRKALFNKVIENRTNHFTVVTEDVYQLHNTSAVIRSCDVFGIQNVHVIEEQKVKKIDREIAMGAQKWVTLNRHDDSLKCISKLREEGYQIIATSPNAEAIELSDFDITKPSALFLGTEKDGLSQEVLSNADQCIKIPMVGFTESLNISVSAAIILQELTSRLRKSKISWELSDYDKNEVKFEWLRKSFKNFDHLVKRFENS